MRPSLLVTLTAGLLLGPVALVSAQLTDIQPGRNFPSESSAFGGNRSENLDLGDADNDGDLDAIIGNGGDGSAQGNLIYINQGGFQGGTTGTFSNGTSGRFAGVPNDTSRDIEFADFDNDCDLDIYVSNRGTTINGGEVSRAYLNLGGLQFGSIGFYSESTDGFWGDLVSVPLGDEVGAQDGQGAWKDYSCDCDFGDIDDDGDVDLFHSSYGPNINGDRDSRVFLNDGTGVFDEHWPWVNAGADIRLHTLDIDLVDLDDDYDLDVFASSRDSQARVYRNNLSGGSWSGDAFTDMTQSALLNTGAGLNGSNNYEGEFADLDADGDFDIWMKNYDGTGGGNLDRVLRNNGDFTFTKMTSWIKGDPNQDENEIDFLDYDSDGDLDAFVANFVGTNRIYQGGVAQGMNEYHRTGTTSSGGQASWNEVPSNGNNNTSLDGECGDLDNDGDPDIAIANDGNQTNDIWVNTLGVPDTFAPTFHQFTNQGNKSDNTDTVIHASLRDNNNYYMIAYYDVDMIYTVNGGPETRVQMLSQGSQQFRGVIPAAVNGLVAYRIEATDRGGNVGTSSTVNYTQTSSASSLWQTLGTGTQGDRGDPYVSGFSVGGGVHNLVLCDAADGALAALFLSVSSTPVPFKGGLLWANPIVVNLALVTGNGGELAFPTDLSAFPSAFPIYWQYAIQDGSAAGGVSVSNAALFTAP